MGLTDEISARRAGEGQPAALVGEFRRTAMLVPVLDGGLMSADYGGLRWIYAFTSEEALERFLRGLAPRSATDTATEAGAASDAPGPGDYVAVLGARLLDSVIPSLDGPTGVAIDVADRDSSMLLPPVRGIVPDSCAVDPAPDAWPAPANPSEERPR